MTRRSVNKSPKGVETRSESKNAEKSKDSKSKQTEKSAVQAKRKSITPKKKDKKTGLNQKSSEKGEVKTSVLKTQTALTDPSNKVNKRAEKAKANSAKQVSQGDEQELDYDEEGLDQELQKNKFASDSDQTSSSGSDSESSSEDSSSSEDETNSIAVDEFSEPESSTINSSANTNNGATPMPGPSGVSKKATKRKRQSQGISTEQKRKKNKVVKMTQQELEQLMNSTIASYEKSKQKNEKGKSVKNPNTDILNTGTQMIATQPCSHSKSETTIYSRLCPPVNPDYSKEQSFEVGDIIQSVENMEVSDSNVSDDSILAQLNSSDENRNVLIPDHATQLKLPPPTKPPTDVHPREAAQELADDMIKQAELQKAELAKPPGEQINFHPNYDNDQSGDNLDGSLDYLHNSGSAHVDILTRAKIKADLYIELHKLLPRDFDLIDEDENLCLTNRDGKTYHVPPLEREGNNVNSFKKWQIAFKVFMAVYIEEHPDRVKKPLEFIQYMQMIEEMTTTWIWENVYKYDKKHRRMMQQFPRRHWHVPYQSAKGVLKTTHAMNINVGNSKNRKSTSSGRGKKDICRNFNRGKCSYGASCRYDHKCATCGRFGHNALQCRQKEVKETDGTKDPVTE